MTRSIPGNHRAALRPLPCCVRFGREPLKAEPRPLQGGSTRAAAGGGRSRIHRRAAAQPAPPAWLPREALTVGRRFDHCQQPCCRQTCCRLVARPRATAPSHQRWHGGQSAQAYSACATAAHVHRAGVASLIHAVRWGRRPGCDIQQEVCAPRGAAGMRTRRCILAVHWPRARNACVQQSPGVGTHPIPPHPIPSHPIPTPPHPIPPPIH